MLKLVGRSSRNHLRQSHCRGARAGRGSRTGGGGM